MLGILLTVTVLATSAQALDDPKVTITYSLETPDGAYRQKISGTFGGAGDVDYVVNTAGSGDPMVTVAVDSPLFVTMEFTADAGGNIIDGPVELTDTDFDRKFSINSGPITATTVIKTDLSRTATGSLSGSTITWDNVASVNVYQEDVVGDVTCSGDPFVCGISGLPKSLNGTNEVPLPTFTISTTVDVADGFVSDGGTPGTPADDIDRFDPAATVKDTWYGVETSRVVANNVPAISEIYLLVGTLGLVGFGYLRKRNSISA
jgi:hypothetical protein